MATKPRKKVEPWQQEDADRLRHLWDTRSDTKLSQADAAAKWGIGTQPVLWQYLKGWIPLNMEVAPKFARGLNCTIADFSPRIAGRIVSAAHLAGREITTREGEIFEYVMRLTSDQQDEILAHLRSVVEINLGAQKMLREKLSSGTTRPRRKATRT